MHTWFAWCGRAGLDPLAATFVNINTYGRWLEQDEGLSTATVARKLHTLSSWYGFLAKINALSGKPNPVGAADIPRVDRDHSTTIGLNPDEIDQLLAAATNPRDRALLTLLADLGLRVSEAVGLDVEHLTVESAVPVIRYTGKGGKIFKRRVPPGTYDALRAYLGRRKTGPMFLSRYGNRLDRHAALRLVKAVAAEAGLLNANDLSPHSLRHQFATAARDQGVPLEDVQDAMGHADPRTTRRYDRDRHNLDRDPSIVLAAARAKRLEGS